LGWGAKNHFYLFENEWGGAAVGFEFVELVAFRGEPELKRSLVVDASDETVSVVLPIRRVLGMGW